MKARITSQTNEYILSIGMIVKNEEKYLDRCLSALKPLLDKVSSELVIVDTGSTDSTIEIAKKYTDKVFHFDWSDDFSAARNYGLEKCRGEWFMFLDADEIFDSDFTEMINFFNNRSFNKKYNSATHQRKDYTNTALTTWVIQTKSRIIRRTPFVKFVNPIHECFNHFSEPTFDLNTFSEHFGYIYENDEQKEKKRLRNLVPLEKCLAANPEDLNTMLLLFRELLPEEQEKYATKIIEVARKNKDIYSEPAFLQIVRYFFDLKDYESTIKYIDEYFEIYKSKSVVALDMYVIKAASLSNMGNTGEAINCYSDYLKCFDDYRMGRLDKTPSRYISIIFIDKEHHEGVKGLYNNLISSIE